MEKDNFCSKNWAESEFSTLNLGDKRLDKRLVNLAEHRSVNINASIAETCGSLANTKGAYRFYENEDVKCEEIIRAHTDSTIKRALNEKILLSIQDTTEFSYGDRKTIKGLGTLNSLKNLGFLLHSDILYTTDKVPIGIISQEFIIRPEEEFGKRVTYNKRSIEEKESKKWLIALEATHRLHLKMPEIEIISLSDRESDIYDFFFKAIELEETVIARAAWDRNVESEQKHLWPYVEKLEEAGKVTIKVPIKDSHKTRDAVFSVKYSSVNIFPPAGRKKEHLKKIRMNAVYLKEITKEEECISWLLLTTKEIRTFEEAVLIVEYYVQRWSIEVFHKILKSGSRILKREFKSVENLKRFITIDSIAGIRIQAMTMIGRTDKGKTPCTAIFEEYEWQALYCFENKVKTPPKEIPTINQMIRWIAKLGGFLGRKGDKEPGIETMWIGMQRFNDIADTWKLLKL